MLKRILSFTLALVLFISLIPAQILAGPDASKDTSSDIWSNATKKSDIELIPSKTASSTNPMTDVSVDDWYYEAVQYVQHNKLFNGTGPDTFSPLTNMTRAMYVTVLGRMAGIDVSAYTNSSFSDVGSDTWYAPYIEWAVEQGITAGIGKGKFSPLTPINREQMATFTMRYLEAYQIELPPVAHNNPPLNDLSKVSPWALSAIQYLWQAGLLKGDANGNFNPQDHAMRAEAASLIMRSDTAIKSSSEQATPAEEPTQTEQTPAGPSVPSGPGPIVTPSPVSHTVSFQTNGGSTLEPLTITAGGTINELPSSYKPDHIFTGWFTDASLSSPLIADTKVTGNMTLYAKYEPEPVVSSYAGPLYQNVSKLDQDADFSITVTSADTALNANQVKAGLSLTVGAESTNIAETELHVTGSNGEYLIQGVHEQGRFEAGTMHYLVLTDDRLVFKDEEAVARQLAFSIKLEEYSNHQLNPGLVSIPANQVTNMVANGESVDPSSLALMKVTMNGNGTASSSLNARGTFTYAGTVPLEVGKTVAIYEGIAPELRTLATTGEDAGLVSYVLITAKNGSNYSFDTPEIDDILVLPDVLPLNINEDTDGNLHDNSVTISKTVFTNEYAPLKDVAIDRVIEVNAGDFLLLVTTNDLPLSFEEAESMSTLQRVVKITSVQSTDTTYTIVFDNSTLVAARAPGESFEELNLVKEESPPEIEPQTMRILEQQVLASGFIESATDQLIASTVQTESYKKLEAELGLPTEELLQVMKTTNTPGSDSGSKVKVDLDKPQFSSSIGTDNTQGMSVSRKIQLEIGATVTIDTGKNSEVKIKLTASFEQELGVTADLKTDFGVIFSRYVYAKGNFGLFSYTAVGLNAKIGLFPKDAPEPDWDKEEDLSEEIKKAEDLKKQYEDLKKQVGDTEEALEMISSEIDGISTSLAEQYANMLEEDTEYVQLVKVPLGEYVLASSYGVFNVTLDVSFVVEAKLNVSLGINMSYKIAKSLDFTLDSRQTETFKYKLNDVEQRFLLNIYVMGELGLRAGVQLDLYASLLKKDFAGVGTRLKLGLYAELYGYFYYQLELASGSSPQNRFDGALYFEIGVFAEGGLLASTFVTGESYFKLFDKNLKIFGLGEEKPVIGFPDLEEDDVKGNEEIHMGSDKKIKLPEFAYSVERMSMTTGKLKPDVRDPSEFTFTFEDEDAGFKYDAKSQSIVYTGSDEYAETKLKITWNKGKRLFGDAPYSTEIPISFGELEDIYSVSIYTVKEAGQAPKLLQKIVTEYDAVLDISDPTRPYYKFKGFYSDENGKIATTIPDKMPGRNLIFFTKWELDEIPFLVEIYLENATPFEERTVPDLVEERTLPGYFANSAYAISATEIEGYETPAKQLVTIARDMSPVRLYYKREIINVRFNTLFKYIDLELPFGHVGRLPHGPSYEGHYLEGYELVASPSRPSSDFIPMSSHFTVGLANSPDDYVIGGKGAIYRAVWKKNEFMALFDADGGVGGTSKYVTFGDPLTAPVVTKEGYTFAGWSPSVPALMPAKPVTYKALWNEIPEASYTVKYYLQDLSGGNNYTIASTETLKALPGTVVEIPVKDFAGFKVNNAPGYDRSGTVRADGSLELSLYYLRETYTATFMIYLIGVTTPVLWTEEVKYGATIPVPTFQEILNEYPTADLVRGANWGLGLWRDNEPAADVLVRLPDYNYNKPEETLTMPARNVTFNPVLGTIPNPA